uniref:DNA2/NAM7 helicase-like C-terminal domain-containing protein n=1 Tax=Craspedostauros australis TaxID=1486917 RepID=A0A7R9WTV0_9STRA|mmetsp:Transcript_20695/g.57519  ORF Transcript_20695/g.57519 Transcript_20695/m.57519 type:complete len:235 (+) Transcript_20695:1-705(+)
MEITHSFGGKSNTAEAVLVTRIVQNLVTANDVEAKHIAVISPYAKQVQKVRSQLALHRLSDVRVGTVDSFQGQETEVVIISAVRSNMFGELGFLRDSRRLCVAITRAKRGLILVGDEPVLRGSHHWGALLDAIQDRNCVIDACDLVSHIRNEGAGKEGAMMTDKEEPHDDDASADELTGEQREAAKTNEGNNTADSMANMEAAVAQALAELLNDDAENEDSESEEELFGLFEKL